MQADVRCFDLRDSPRPITRKIGKGWRRGKIVKRDPSTVTAIGIHQTACEFGAGRWRLRKAGGDRQKAIAHRALDQPYHAMAFDGFYALGCPLDWFTHHGNALNRFTLGLGIDGLYPELEMRRRPKHTRFTERRIESARRALAALVTQGRDAGMPITNIVAHRQTNAKKPSDPSQIVWREVVENYAVAVLGLKPLYDYVDGGKAIPDSWHS